MGSTSHGSVGSHTSSLVVVVKGDLVIVYQQSLIYTFKVFTDLDIINSSPEVEEAIVGVTDWVLGYSNHLIGFFLVYVTCI